jgi:hypothetical protein
MPTVRIGLPGPLFNIHLHVKQFKAAGLHCPTHVSVAASAVDIRQNLRHAGVAVGMMYGYPSVNALSACGSHFFFARNK